jgi:hypothetical protein
MDIEFETWGISLDFWSQWTLPWKNNWVDFTLIHIGGEYSPYKASSELCLGLLGLNLLVTVWKRHSPASKAQSKIEDLPEEPKTDPDPAQRFDQVRNLALCANCGQYLNEHDPLTNACSRVEL